MVHDLVRDRAFPNDHDLVHDRACWTDRGLDHVPDGSMAHDSVHGRTFPNDYDLIHDRACWTDHGLVRVRAWSMAREWGHDHAFQMGFCSIVRDGTHVLHLSRRSRDNFQCRRNRQQSMLLLPGRENEASGNSFSDFDAIP